MKRKFISLLILICALTNSFAQYSVSEFKNLIDKYDISKATQEVPQNKPEEFWTIMLSSNKGLNKFFDDLQGKNWYTKGLKERYERIPRFYPEYEEAVVDDFNGFCDSLLIDMNVKDLNLSDCSIHILASNDINAYTLLKEEGFAIGITSSLLLRKGVTYNILKGYAAHEMAHGLLKHHMRQIYAEDRAKLKNGIIAAAAAGLTAVAAGLDAYSSASLKQRWDSQEYERRIMHILEKNTEANIRFSFKYSREQEFEADLIAYRFMENQGLGEEYINGLRLLGADYDKFYNSNDAYQDHPSIQDRILFLKYVKKNRPFFISK